MIQKPRTRYFLIFFAGINKQRQPVSATIEHKGKTYPSKENISAHIKREYGCEEFWLRGINELSREDFESYTGEAKSVESFDAANDRITQEWMDEQAKASLNRSRKQEMFNYDLISAPPANPRDMYDLNARGLKIVRPSNPEAEGCGA